MQIAQAFLILVKQVKRSTGILLKLRNETEDAYNTKF